MQYVNLTKHPIKIHSSDSGNPHVVTIPPSGNEARITTETNLVEVVDGVEFYETEVLGEPYLQDNEGGKTDLPPEQAGTVYIVSGMFRANYDRPDLYQPGKLLRDGKGNVVGCVGLSR